MEVTDTDFHCCFQLVGQLKGMVEHHFFPHLLDIFVMNNKVLQKEQGTCCSGQMVFQCIYQSCSVCKCLYCPHLTVEDLFRFFSFVSIDQANQCLKTVLLEKFF